MPLYPLPAILAIVLWLLVFWATGVDVIAYFAIVFASGIFIYLLKSYLQKQWPFN